MHWNRGLGDVGRWCFLCSNGGVSACPWLRAERDTEPSRGKAGAEQAGWPRLGDTCTAGLDLMLALPPDATETGEFRQPLPAPGASQCPFPAP